MRNSTPGWPIGVASWKRCPRATTIRAPFAARSGLSASRSPHAFSAAPGEEASRMPITVAGRHVLQTPGPTNVPDRVLRAMDRNAINHRGPEFGALGREIAGKLRRAFQTEGTVAIFPASGTGAWEAAMVNTLSPGDRVLMSRTGWFAHLWEQLAARHRLDPVSCSRPTGGAARTQRRSPRCWRPTGSTASRRSASCSARLPRVA